MENRERSNTFAIFRDATKYTEKLHTCEHIYVGTAENGLLFAIGFSAENDLLVPTSFKGTEEHIPEKSDSCAPNATRNLCAAII